MEATTVTAIEKSCPSRDSPRHRKDDAYRTSAHNCAWAATASAPGLPRRAKRPLVENIDMEDVDGVWHMRFNAVRDLNGYIRTSLRHLPMRSDDVITCGFPRSGNHWCFEIVNMVLNHTTEFKPEYFAENLLDIPGTLGKIPSPRNLVTHLRPHNFPLEFMDKKVKVIYLLRNPKDAVVSMYNMNSQYSFANCRYLGNWEQFLDLHLMNELPLGLWWDHVLEMENFAAASPDIPVHVLQYEKVKECPVEEIRKLCQFLECPSDLVERIADVTRFDNMKTILGARDSGKIAAIEKAAFYGKDVVLRKGQVGDWSNWFTPAQSERFNRAFLEGTRSSRWAKLVYPYMGLNPAS